MKTLVVLPWFFLVGFCILTANDKELNKRSLINLQETFQNISKKTQPHIVQIRADNEEDSRFQKISSLNVPVGLNQYFQPQTRKSSCGVGSGFMIFPAGLIVTNHHVIESANRFYVKLADKTEVVATLVGSNEDLDLAVLKISAKHCKPITWGDSSAVKSGNIVFAFGSPFGLQNTVTKGIVSAIGRPGWQDENMHYIQTDAAINTGNSGGPLVDLNGNVIGINTWILSPAGVNSGLGFALPSNIAKAAIDNILSKNNEAAWLGIILQPDEIEKKGVSILGVLPGSPAEKAGLKPGDRLIKFNGNTIDSHIYLKVLLANAYRQPKLIVQLESSPYRVALAKETRPLQVKALNFSNEDVLKVRNADEIFSVFNEVATLRVCHSDKKSELLHCQNCTSAKNDLSYLLRLIRAGYSKDKIIRLMDSPIVLTAWLDIGCLESIEFYQTIKKLSNELAPLVRIQVRHYPSDIDISAEWKERVNIFEALRLFGLEEILLSRLNSKVDFEEGLEMLYLDFPSVKKQVEETRNCNHYGEQIYKDLKDGPFQYGVRSAPSLLINLELERGGLTEESLRQRFRAVLLKKSF